MFEIIKKGLYDFQREVTLIMITIGNDNFDLMANSFCSSFKTSFPKKIKYNDEKRVVETDFLDKYLKFEKNEL